jgi:hypothetical protein
LKISAEPFQKARGYIFKVEKRAAGGNPPRRNKVVPPSKNKIHRWVVRLLNGNEHSLEKMNATAEITSEARLEERHTREEEEEPLGAL